MAMRRKRRRAGVPMWARAIGLVVGPLVLFQVYALGDRLGLLEQAFFVLLGIAIIICALLPSRQRRD